MNNVDQIATNHKKVTQIDSIERFEVRELNFFGLEYQYKTSHNGNIFSAECNSHAIYNTKIG